MSSALFETVRFIYVFLDAILMIIVVVNVIITRKALNIARKEFAKTREAEKRLREIDYRLDKSNSELIELKSVIQDDLIKIRGLTALERTRTVTERLVVSVPIEIPENNEPDEVSLAELLQDYSDQVAPEGVDNEEAASNGDTGKDERMEPTVLIGLIGSLASIVGLMQQNKESLTVQNIMSHFRRRQSDEATPEHQIGQILVEDEIEAQASRLLALRATDQLWYDRILKRCIQPLNIAIADHEMDEVDLEEKRGEASKCVCANLRMLRDSNGGKFPSQEFKEWWRDFNCS